MSLVRFIVILSIGTVLSWGTWVIVLMTLDPQTGGVITLAMFYLSLWLGLLGTITIIGFFLRVWLEKESVFFRQVATALRQATVISSGAVLALLLQGARWLNAWSGVSLILLVILIEVFFLAGQSSRPTHRDQAWTT